MESILFPTVSGNKVMETNTDDPWKSGCTLLRQLGTGRFGMASLVRRGPHSVVRHTLHRVTNTEDRWQRLRALRLPTHQNLEELVHVFVVPNQIAIFTQYYGELTLLDFIRAYFEPMLPETQVLHWMCHILDGLQFLHVHGLQHGNLSAKNVLLIPGHSKLLRLTNWTMSMFSQKSDSRTDLECLGSILLVLITLNSALDGRSLTHDTVSSLLKSGQAHFSDFLLSITHDLISNSMESVSYLRGLMVTPDDSLYGSQPEMPSLEGDHQISQVDASPVHRRERARILHQLAEEAARAPCGGAPKHPSMIITFFNLFKMSVKRWKRILKRLPFASNSFDYELGKSECCINNYERPDLLCSRKLSRSISCPGLFYQELNFHRINTSDTVTG
ncbi:serine/threonine-protein kinase greatwall-like [Tropilaelaps mercedesae]|uniref:non-specific serine/threonine protein kinase n=1 Tax=Tropilaelaps mercedesae TaxID=418985 RepID=A0A1V9XXT1_9ACAR|nr:serine/threonine-protein kinase greatwall-like [Tropilaelaps mercedesae]